MNVGVMPELLIPGVKDGDQTRGGAEMGPTHIDDSLRGRFKQQGVCEARVMQEERVEAGRKGEDLVKVANGQQVLHLSLDPEGLVEALTLRTVSIPAGVIDRTLSPAVIAPLEVPAQNRGATCDQGTDDTSLVAAEVREKRLPA